MRLDRLVQPLSWFYRRVGRYVEGVELFETALRSV